MVTECALTKAAGEGNSDAAVGMALLVGEEPGLQVLGDSAYGAGAARPALAEDGHQAVIKPAPLRPAVPGGFTVDDFTVDAAAGTVTCPAGQTVTLTPSRAAIFGRRCAAARCEPPAPAAAAAALCGSVSTMRCCAARRQAGTPEFQAVYRQHRPMVERCIAWLARGNRKLRYRGVAKNDWWLHTRVAGLNLRRLLNLGLVHNGNAWALA